MKIGKRVLYLVIILLLGEVAKLIVTRAGYPVSFFLSSLIACLQFFLLLGSLIFYAVRILVPARWSSGYKRIFPAIIVFLLFTGAECLFGYWLNNPRQIPRFLQRSFYYYYDTYDFRVIQYEKDQSIYDSGLTYRLKPGAHFNFSNREFNNEYRINSAGLRDDEASMKNPGIICLGDSYAMGWGVEQEETFSQQLEQLSGLRVLNAAISSYGTARELKLLQQLDTASVRYIVIQYCPNDIIENSTFINHQFELPVSSEEKFEFLRKEYRLGRQYYPGKHFLLIGQIYLKQQLNKVYPLFNLTMERFRPFSNTNEQATVFMSMLSHAGLSASKAKIIVLTMGSIHQFPDPFCVELRKMLQEEKLKAQWQNKIRVVSIDDLLLRGDFYDLDLHIRASGHKKIAQLIWESIQKD